MNARRGATNKEEYDMNREEYRQHHNKIKKTFRGILTSKYFESFDDNNAKKSNEKQQQFLDIAAKIALRSPMLQKHGAVIVYKNEIISRGFNYFQADYSIHAEVSAIKSVKGKYKNVLSECEIYVVRIGPNKFQNVLKYSKPCCNCQNAIIKHNLKKAFYSTNYAYDNVRGAERIINNCIIA